MRGNGIRAECVQHEQIEGFIVRLYQLQAAVADDHIAIRAASSEECEVPARDRLDRWIDLIERHVMFVVRICRHRSRPEADDAEPLLRSSFTQHLHNVGYRAVLVVIRQGLSGPLRVRTLDAVQRVPVEKLSKMRSRLESFSTGTRCTASRVRTRSGPESP